jgi:hypothetical protein
LWLGGSLCVRWGGGEGHYRHYTLKAGDHREMIC